MLATSSWVGVLGVFLGAATPGPTRMALARRARRLRPIKEFIMRPPVLGRWTCSRSCPPAGRVEAQAIRIVPGMEPGVTVSSRRGSSRALEETDRSPPAAASDPLHLGLLRQEVAQGEGLRPVGR